MIPSQPEGRGLVSSYTGFQNREPMGQDTAQRRVGKEVTMSEQSEVAEEGKLTAPVVVTRQVPHVIKDVWKVLLTDAGTEALLGAGGRLGTKGQGWQAEDGTHGVTRSFHAMEQIRFSWHKDAEAEPTLVELDIQPAGDEATDLVLTHSRLPGDADREALTAHWTKALDRIAEDAL